MISLGLLLGTLALDCKYVITLAGHDCASDINNIVHTNVQHQDLQQCQYKNFEKLGSWRVHTIDTVKCSYNNGEAVLNITISPPRTKRFKTYREEALEHKSNPVAIYYNRMLVQERDGNGVVVGDTMLEKYDDCYYETVYSSDKTVILLLDMETYIKREIEDLFTAISASRT